MKTREIAFKVTCIIYQLYLTRGVKAVTPISCTIEKRLIRLKLDMALSRKNSQEFQMFEDQLGDPKYVQRTPEDEFTS